MSWFVSSQRTSRADLLASIKSKAFEQASLVCAPLLLAVIVSFSKTRYSFYGTCSSLSLPRRDAIVRWS